MIDDSKKAMLIRLPKSLMSGLKRLSARRGISVNQLCTESLKVMVEPERTSPRKVLLNNDFSSALTEYVEGVIIPAFGKKLIGVLLFGSAARGEMKRDSDIDILIVLKDAHFDRDIYDRIKTISINDHTVSPLVVQLPTNEEALRSVWLEASIDGVMLFDTDFTLSRLLSHIRLQIISGVVKRRLAYGVPYWLRSEEINSDKELL